MSPIFFVNKWTIPHLTSPPRRIQYMSETSIYPLKQTLLCSSVAHLVDMSPVLVVFQPFPEHCHDLITGHNVVR